ncbi:hypothetical protein ACHWQZ_G010356 [Mnemiopsis leidyi]
MIMLRSILLTVLLSLAWCQVSKKCMKAYKAFPPPTGGVLTRPVATTEFLTCNMLAETCCGAVTEYHMKQKADTDFTALVLSTINGRLANVNSALADNSLTPIVFYQDFNDLVRMEGEVTYRELTTKALRYYIKESCMTHEETMFLRQRHHMYVKDFADFLKAIYSGLDTIKRALEIVSEHKVSDECQVAVMKNGLYTGSDFGISMCQVCHRDTEPFLPCPSTCKNIARGCLNDLTEVGALLNDLASVLDRVHYQLLLRTERPSSELSYIESDIRASFERKPEYAAECSTGADFTYVENDSQAQPANFSASPLNLNGVIQSSADYACLKSEPITGNCWTEGGVTEQDIGTVDPFTTQSQMRNVMLPRPEVQSDEILRAEQMIREATELARKAHSGHDLFSRDFTQPPVMLTEKPDVEPVPVVTDSPTEQAPEEPTDELESTEAGTDMDSNMEDNSKQEETVDKDGRDDKETDMMDKEEDSVEVDQSNEENEKDEDDMAEKESNNEDTAVDMTDGQEEEEESEPDSGKNETDKDNDENEIEVKDPGYNVAEGNDDQSEEGGQEEASTDKKPADSSVTTIFVGHYLILSAIFRLI